jgi:hypothetical protein
MTRLRLVLAGEPFEAVLLEREAPRTCEAFLRLLPLDGELWHSHFIGPALTTPLAVGALPAENPYALSIPAGAILLDIRQQPVVIDGKALPPELVIVYGTGARMLNWSGFSPANLFGRVEGDLERLVEVGRRVQYGGVSTVQVTLTREVWQER